MIHGVWTQRLLPKILCNVVEKLGKKAFVQNEVTVFSVASGVAHIPVQKYNLLKKHGLFSLEIF
jgi:hypothetical protein